MPKHCVSQKISCSVLIYNVHIYIIHSTVTIQTWYDIKFCQLTSCPSTLININKSNVSRISPTEFQNFSRSPDVDVITVAYNATIKNSRVAYALYGGEGSSQPNYKLSHPLKSLKVGRQKNMYFDASTIALECIRPSFHREDQKFQVSIVYFMC